VPGGKLIEFLEQRCSLHHLLTLDGREQHSGVEGCGFRNGSLELFWIRFITGDGFLATVPDLVTSGVMGTFLIT
jgi:hypothetical protein